MRQASLKAHQIVTMHVGHRKESRKVDPLIRAQRKAFNASEPGKLQALLDEESRWKRKLTIARNKLEEARQAVNDYAKELADRVMKEGK